MDLSMSLSSVSPAAIGRRPSEPPYPPPLINLEGDDLSQIKFGIPPNMEEWGDFKQLNASWQPSHDGTMNGKTTPSFSGSSEVLERAALPITDMTFLFVLKKDVNALTKRLISQDDTAGASSKFFVAVFGNGSIIVNGGATSTTSITGAIPDNTPVVLSIVCPIGQNAPIYVNGSDVVLSYVSNWNPSAGANLLHLGGFKYTSPIATWDGLISRFQVWNSVLSTEDRQAAEAEAAAEWI